MSIMIDHYADGTNNNVTSSRNWVEADQHIYSLFTPQAAAAAPNEHHLNVAIGIFLPSNFFAFQAPDAFRLTFKTIGSAFVLIERVIDSLGFIQTVGLPPKASSATKSVINVPVASLTGTFKPDTLIWVHIRAGSPLAGTPFTTETAFVGLLQHFMRAAD